MFFLVLQHKNLWRNRLQTVMGKQVSPFTMDNLNLTAILDFRENDHTINYNLEKYLSQIWTLSQYEYPDCFSNIIEWHQSPRSLDFGDIIQAEDHRIFVIEHDGFKLIEQKPIIHVAQPCDDGPGDPFDFFSTLHKNWSGDTVHEMIKMGWYYREICEYQGEIYHRVRQFK